jgi:ABC-type uncharacterized transport system substrate-binding protein
VLKDESQPISLVQQSTKFQLVINLRIVEASALTIPQSILARSSEVIE